MVAEHDRLNAKIEEAELLLHLARISLEDKNSKSNRRSGVCGHLP